MIALAALAVASWPSRARAAQSRTGVVVTEIQNASASLSSAARAETSGNPDHAGFRTLDHADQVQFDYASFAASF